MRRGGSGILGGGGGGGGGVLAPLACHVGGGCGAGSGKVGGVRDGGLGFLGARGSRRGRADGRKREGRMGEDGRGRWGLAAPRRPPLGLVSCGVVASSGRLGGRSGVVVWDWGPSWPRGGTDGRRVR
jgi:hypothetical protein